MNASYPALLLVRLAVGGPGRFSVDSASGITVTGWAGGGIALGVAVVATAGLLATSWRPKRAAEPGGSGGSGGSEAEA